MPEQIRQSYTAQAVDLARRGKSAAIAYAKKHPVRTAVVTPLALATPFVPASIYGLMAFAGLDIFISNLRSNSKNRNPILAIPFAVGIVYGHNVWNTDEISSARSKTEAGVLHQINDCASTGVASEPYTDRSLWTWRTSQKEITLHGKVIDCHGNAPAETYMTVEFDDGNTKSEKKYHVFPPAPKGYEKTETLTWEPR